MRGNALVKTFAVGRHTEERSDEASLFDCPLTHPAPATQKLSSCLHTIFLQVSKYAASRRHQKERRTSRQIRRHVLRHGHRTTPAYHAAAAFRPSRGPGRQRNPERTRHPQFHALASSR